MVTMMAKRRPAPAPDVQPADDGGTDSIRVSREMKRMVKWICEIEDITAQELMNWAARDRLLTRFEPYREKVELEEAMEAERKARLAELKRLGRKGP